MSSSVYSTESPMPEGLPDCDNCSTGGRSEADPEILAQVAHLTSLALIITLVCYVPILIFGLFGNTVSFLFLIKRAKSSSACTYLCSLAVIDNIFLIRTVGNWIIYCATSGKTDMRQILDCNFMAILLYISKEVSSWLRVALSVERALVIYLPAKAKSITSVTRARGVVGIIILLTTLSNWQAFGAYRTKKGADQSGADTCPGRTPWLEHYNSIIHGWIDATLYAYIPIVCILALNAAIIAKFAAAARNNKVDPNVSQAMAKSSRKMTVVCVTISGTFILLSLPHTIHNLVFRAASEMAVTDPVGFYTHFLISQILSILYRTNHAINLALYCMTSARFRQNLRRLFICRIRRGVIESSESPAGNNRTRPDNIGTGPAGAIPMANLNPTQVEK